MDNEKKLELLRQGWKEVFEVDAVPDDADFFEAGGDSIKAVQLSAWLLQKGLKLDLGRIFYTPVFSQMAETLEETDPVFVPDQLMTKELAGEKLESILAGMQNTHAAAIEESSGNDQQICDPDSMGAGSGQQVCDPANMGAGSGQQVCDPANMGAGSGQQVCDPANMGAGSGQQVCDPDSMGAGSGQQVCDPANMGAGSGQQVCDPANMGAGSGQQICDPNSMGANYGQPAAGLSDPFFNMMTSMFQTMMSQQQVMLQMMQLMMHRMTVPAQAPAFMPPRMPNMPAMPKGNPFPVRNAASPKMRGNWAFRPENLPPEVGAELQRQMKQYESHKVDKPIEKPNVIGLKKATVMKPKKSPQEVLDHVLGGLLKNGFNKTDDLFEQGLTSLDTVKMVTRCAEHGYALSMQDIYMHSNYDELIKCMKPGK